MASPNGGQPIDQGIISRLATGVRFALSGKTAGEFFGPGQPLPPAAQVETHGRQFDYPINYNITTRPRSDERIDFPTLRALADYYDLVRLAIETRKDQMGKLRWTITRKDTGEQDDTAKQIEEFFQEPDGEHDFQDWSRMFLEDLLVIDAPTAYIHPNLGGGVYAVEPIDGATIKRVIDGRGRTPLPPEPAYQQVIKGLPVTDYHRDELIYKPRNPRVHKIYGFSPVEQIIVIVNIGLRRQAHQLAFYTAGNIPEMLMGTPQEWNPDQIAKFQKLWDLMMVGDLEARRQLKFIPGDVKPLALRPEASLFDMFDEWLARVVCYCFSLPPQAFVKQQNRATAETAQDAALEEGLAPLMEWQVSFMNRIIRKGWKTRDYVFGWLDEQDMDPLVQAQVDHIYVTDGVRLPNEIRDDHGWEQRPELDDRRLNPPELAPPPEPVDPKKVADDAAEKVLGVVRAEWESRDALARLAANEASITAAAEKTAAERVQLAAEKEAHAAKVHADQVAARQAEEMARIEKLAQQAVDQTAQNTMVVAGAAAKLDSMPRKLFKALRKRARHPQRMSEAYANMVQHGVPPNIALEKAGYVNVNVPGGDVPLVNAKLVPLAIAAELGNEPAPVEKRAPDPAPVVVPIPEVNLHLTLEQKGGQARTIRLTKANGETVTADVQPGPSTVTMITPNGETVTADITDKE